MSCRPERWWLGLAPLALVWVGANLLLPERVEGDLATRAAGRLRAEAGWARVEASGRDVTLAGEAPSEQARRRALTLLDGLPGLRAVRDGTGVMAVQSPFALTALIEPGGARLEGFVPPERRAEVIAAAREALGREVALDRLKDAGGAPASFLPAASFAFGLLARMQEGRASLSDTRVTLHGAARDRAAYDDLRSAAARAPEGVVLDVSGLLPPRVSPYRVAVSRTGDRLRLSGFVPNDAARRDALAAARSAAPELQVEDGLELASGFPEGPSLRDAVGFAAGALARLEAGTVEIVDRRVSLDGAAADRGGTDALVSAWKGAMPPGLDPGAIKVRTVPASPFTFRIRRAPGEVVLSGYVPDEETRNSVVAAAKDLFLMERVVDRARVADGAPRGFREAALAGIEVVAQTSGGEAVLTDASLALSGEVLYPQTAERIRRDAPRTAPKGWKVNAAVTVPGEERLDGAACRRRVADLLAKNPVRFADGAELQRRSYGVLDDLAEALRACPDAAIEVVGLPEGATPAPERAKAVRDQLVQAGVPEERVLAAGEGPKPGEDLVPGGAVAIRWKARG